MRGITVGLTIAGTVSGAAALALMLSGWIGLVPYALVGSGVLLIAAAVAGIISGRPLDG